MNNTLEPAIVRELNGRHADQSPHSTRQIQPVPGPKPENKQRPRLGCAGLIRRGASVLLGKRDKEPNRGLWVLPGGGVEFCESYFKTLERELLEEAGIPVALKSDHPVLTAVSYTGYRR